MMPLANHYAPSCGQEMPRFPLHLFVCETCLLAQLNYIHNPARLFTHYPYFSSYSTSWVDHARSFADLVLRRFFSKTAPSVIEIASNDGYLLQHFKGKAASILGIEPAVNIAKEAQAKGIPTQAVFLGEKEAQKIYSAQGQADLLIANNVLAHVPDLHDFVLGLKQLLAPEGILTVECPHLLSLLKDKEFDTIYHEHVSYFSLLFLKKLFAKYDLALFDVEKLSTHGGSLRLYIQHKEKRRLAEPRVFSFLQEEVDFGLEKPATYTAYGRHIDALKKNIFSLLSCLKKEGKTVVGYGAPAKGTTLLNACEITADLLPLTVDRNPHKQGKFLPGTAIPIAAPSEIARLKPDYLLLLPWNLKKEIICQMQEIGQWGGKFILPIPHPHILDSPNY